MRQTGKLYKYYFRKIFQRNWKRLIFVAIAVGVVWFAVPYIFFKYNRKMAKDELKVVRVSSQYEEEKILARLRNIKKIEFKIKDKGSFRDFSKSWLGKDTAEFWSAEREVLEKL